MKHLLCMSWRRGNIDQDSDVVASFHNEKLANFLPSTQRHVTDVKIFIVSLFALKHFFNLVKNKSLQAPFFLPIKLNLISYERKILNKRN